jgi:hypothetical protein
VRDVGEGASWRTDRLTHTQLLVKILANGLPISPLLLAPWCDSAIFRVDWLHAADQGVTADWLGHLFKLLISRLDGANLRTRTVAFWLMLQNWYKERKIDNRLQNLVPTMIQQPKKAPKLRASGAQVRALVPFALTTAEALLRAEVRVEEAALIGTRHLAACYDALSTDSVFPVEVMRFSSIQFALQYVSLEAASLDPKSWRVKPKLHVFLEVCSEGGRPAMFWNYRDEDWGGSLAKMSRRRGGVLSVKSFSSNVLDRFKIQQPVIRMLAAR